MDQNAAARAQRQAFDVLGLRKISGHTIGDRGGTGQHIPDRQTADLGGRRRVALDQRRRNGQRVGDIVEAFARIVGGKKRRGVDIDREQVANGVGVFGAIQTMESRECRGLVWRARRDPARASSLVANASSVARSGRGMPPGGIMPARTLRTTFSQVSASGPGCARSSLSSIRPAVLSLLVMAGDAVLIEQRLFGRLGLRTGCLLKDHQHQYGEAASKTR